MTIYYIVAVECGKPSNGTNTVPVDTYITLKFGEEYIYSCVEGFELASSNVQLTIRCESDGLFSASAPNCTGRFLEPI